MSFALTAVVIYFFGPHAFGLFVKIVQLLKVNWNVPSLSGMTNGTLQASTRYALPPLYSWTRSTSPSCVCYGLPSFIFPPIHTSGSACSRFQVYGELTTKTPSSGAICSTHCFTQLAGLVRRSIRLQPRMRL